MVHAGMSNVFEIEERFEKSNDYVVIKL